MKIGPTLLLLRESQKLSQREVATKAGIGPSQLSKYERDENTPTLDSLERVLAVLGVELPGFFIIAGYTNRCIAALGPDGGDLATLLLPFVFPGTGFPEMEAGFRTILSNLLDLYRAAVLAVHQAKGAVPPNEPVPSWGLSSRD